MVILILFIILPFLSKEIEYIKEVILVHKISRDRKNCLKFFENEYGVKEGDKVIMPSHILL